MVDEDMRQLFDSARAMGFDVQEWARDQLSAGKKDLVQFIDARKPKDAA